MTQDVPLIEIGPYTCYSGWTHSYMSAYTHDDLSAYKHIEIMSQESYVALGSLSISDDINHRSSASFKIYDPGQTFQIRKGMQVSIYHGADLIFAGIVDSVTERLIGQQSSFKEIEISAVDYTVIAERRVISYAHDSSIYCGQIVESILTNYLNDEGITAGEIMNGTELPRAIFPFKTITEIMDSLASMSGYIWYIDYDKKLYFIDRTTNPSEFDIDDYSRLLSFEVTEGNPQYRNVQYVIGSKVHTQEITEYFKGDGEQRTYVVGYPIVQEPTIYVNGNIKDVGIKGVEENKDWYWNKNDQTITQDQNDPPLSSSDVLRVDYVGAFPLVVKVTQYSEVTTRKLIEQIGSGRYESVAYDTTSSDYYQALETARGMLYEYGSIGKQVTYRTLDKITSGTLQHIQLSKFGLDYDFLITNVNITWEDNVPVYEVTAVTGPIDPSWEDIFCIIAKNACEKYTDMLSESDVVQGYEEFTKTYAWDDVPNPFREVFPDSTTPSNNYFPCFAAGDRAIYCVLYSGNEFFRKAITYSDDDGKTLSTITVINANEANGVPITHVGIWGGDSATSASGTGVELCKFAYSKTKSSLESLQFNIYLVRGWV